MRRNAISSAVQEEESEINLTPMLDVVFIMLIFFIVTANFIKEPWLFNKIFCNNKKDKHDENNIKHWS